MSLLEVKGLSFSVARGPFYRKRKKQILKNVTFSLEEGSTLGLIGESGSGKTTIARCVAGLYQPDAGSIDFSGKNIFPETRNRESLGPRIQLLFQNHTASLDPRLTIRKSLLEGVRDTDGLPLEEIARKLLSLVELPEDVLTRYPHQLSGGQRQRVALARVLSVSPQLLILDEPTSALDALTQVQILKMIKEVQRRTSTAMLYISHDILTTSLVCDRIAVLYGGIIVEVGEAKQVLEHPQHPYSRRIAQTAGTKIDG